MEKLHALMTEQLQSKLVEPNSDLGKAYNDMLNWAERKASIVDRKPPLSLHDDASLLAFAGSSHPPAAQHLHDLYIRNEIARVLRAGRLDVPLFVALDKAVAHISITVEVILQLIATAIEVQLAGRRVIVVTVVSPLPLARNSGSSRIRDRWRYRC